MKPVLSKLSLRWLVLGGGGALAAAAALAQSGPGGALDGRVFKLEKEMRAVQRKVFPGATGMGLEPEIQAPATAPTPGGLPATSAVGDLTNRVDALERQLASVTSQAEQAGYTVRQLQDQMARMKSDYDYRLGVLEKGAPPAPGGALGGQGAMADTPPTSIDRAKPAVAAATPPAPAVGDNAEDAYMAGYRLWSQKKYPEAEATLKAMVAKYPSSSRASYGQNLLGRAYLDEGKPGLAAEALLKNYQNNPKGERAPDSLYYLGQALVKLNKPAEACKAYGELDDVYGAKLTDALKGRLKQARADARCS